MLLDTKLDQSLPRRFLTFLTKYYYTVILSILYQNSACIACVTTLATLLDFITPKIMTCLRCPLFVLWRVTSCEVDTVISEDHKLPQGVTIQKASVDIFTAVRPQIPLHEEVPSRVRASISQFTFLKFKYFPIELTVRKM